MIYSLILNVYKGAKGKMLRRNMQRELDLGNVANLANF